MAENHQFDPKAPQPAGRLKRLAPLAALLLITIGFYWKLALTDQYTWFDHPDMAYLEIPRLQFQAHEIHEGRFPLWNPRIWSGQPLIGQTQPGPLFPLNLLFNAMRLRDGYLRFAMLNYYWVVIHFLAACFFFCLGRELGLSQASALVSSCVFGFGGFVGTVAWLDVVNGAIWAPLVLLFLVRSATVRDRPLSNAALGGLFLGIAWLSGHHELPILLSLMAAGCWIYYGKLGGRAVRWRIGSILLFFVVAGLIGGIQMLPTYEFGKLSMRWLGIENTVTWKDKIPYTVHTIYSLPATGLLATFLPGFGRFADAGPFMGVVAVALAILALLASWRRQMVRVAAGMAGISTVYALGTFAPLNGVMYALLPVVDKARIPSRAVLVLNFALAILAAFGLEFILRDTMARATWRLRIGLTAAGCFLLAVSVAMTHFGQNMDDRTVLAGVVCLVAALMLWQWQTSYLKRGALVCGLLGLSLIELTNGGPAIYSNRYDRNANKYLNALTQHQDVVAYLRSLNQGSLKQGPLRVHVDDSAIGANFGDWHGIDMLQGYVAGVSLNVMLHEFHTPRTQSLFSVTHFLGAKPERPEQTEVFKGRDGVSVFQNSNALPRVRTVHDTKVVPDEGWLRLSIQDAALDLARTAVFVQNGPRLEQCGGTDSVELREHTSDRAVIHVNMACRGLLVVSESMYPGWEALIDGQRAELWQAYGTLRSVVVDGGTHRVEMRFRPKSVYFGAALTALGLVVVAVVCVMKK